MATGTATIDFGAWPGGNAANVVITGQTAITATSKCEAYMMASTTADHNADEHILAPIRLVCGSRSAGVGFTIFATCPWTLTGTWSVEWVWV